MSPKAAADVAKLATGPITETISFAPVDFILYALSIGAEDVVSPAAKDLPLVFEEFNPEKDKSTATKLQRFSIFPTFFTTPSFRTTWRRQTIRLPPLSAPPTLVHLAQRLIIHASPLPAINVTSKRPRNGGAFPHPALNTYRSTANLLDVVERANGKGLTTITRTDTWEVLPNGSQGRLICTNYSVGMIGGPGLEGIGRKLPTNLQKLDALSPLRLSSDEYLKNYTLLSIPTHTPPTYTVTYETHPTQAALHRLVAHDDNAIHISPAGANEAGFPGPILHGLATFGICGKLVADACFPADGSLRLRSLNARFAGVVIPGDLLLVKIWDPLGKQKANGGAYKPGTKQFKRVVEGSGERSLRVVVFEAFVVDKDGKDRAVVKDGQVEFWEDISRL